MYLPKHQYIQRKISELGDLEGMLDEAGNLITNLNKSVIVTAAGVVYDLVGVNLDRGDFTNAKRLFPKVSTAIEEQNTNSPGSLNEEDPQLGSRENTISVKLPPTTKERELGIMKRCFYRNLSTGKVKEVLKPQALKLQQSRQKYEQIVCVDWVVKGPLEDQLIKGYFLEGVRSKNEKTLQLLEKNMPGVDTLITSPAEYVENTNIQAIQQPTVNNPGLIIPSPGKKL